MKTALLAASAALFVFAPALADDEVMRGYFGNTLIVKGGMVDTYTHFHPDHTFDASAMVLGARVTRKGTWKLDDKGQLCRWIDNPPAGAPNPLCFALSAHKPGDSWTMTVNGATRTVTLKAGVH
jgi:hypothetical protein